MAKQHWYVATLIIRCRVENQPAPWTCDEQVRVIRAANDDEAYDKAVALGKSEETVYKNGDGEDVFWEFIGLEDLTELDSAIRDGTEIRSRLFGHQDPASLVYSETHFRSNSPRGEYRIPNENVPAEDN